jgi:hypothetical protein
MTWRKGMERMASAMAQLVLDGGNRAPEAMRVLMQGAGLIDSGKSGTTTSVNAENLQVNVVSADDALRMLRAMGELGQDDDD